MKIKSVLSCVVLGAAMVTLSACDSGEPSVDEMLANVFSGECLYIAGDSKFPIQLTSGGKETMALSINSDCTFAAVSPSTGTSYGKLQPTGNGNYTGAGNTQACPSGKFGVSITNGNLYANCL